MKTLTMRFALPVLLIAAALTGCDKQDAQVFYTGGTKPKLTVSTTAPALLPGKEKEVAMAFNWTNPNYQFTTGISSQDVRYRLEFDTVGAQFKSVNKGIVAIANDLTTSLTVEQMNALLSGANGMKLPPDKKYNLEVRLMSALGQANAVPLYSDTIRFTATPFTPPPVVELPSSGKLFLVGDASPGGWANPVPANQEFTKVSNTMYEITVDLVGGKSMLMLPVNGSWNEKYGWDGSNNANNPNGDKLKKGGGDIKVPAANGKYKISVNFQDGVFTIIKQ